MPAMRTVLSLSAIFFCFCALSAQAKPPVRVVSKELHFSLELPDGWKRQANAPPAFWVYAGPAENNFAPNMSVILGVQIPPVLTDERAFFADLGKQFGKNGTVYETKKTLAGGLPAYLWRTHLHIAGQPDTENWQIFTIYDKHAYEITFTAPAALKQKYGPISEKIFSSIRFEK